MHGESLLLKFQERRVGVSKRQQHLDQLVNHHSDDSFPGVNGCGVAVKRQAGKQRELGLIPRRGHLFHFPKRGLWTLSFDFAPHKPSTVALGEKLTHAIIHSVIAPSI